MGPVILGMMGHLSMSYGLPTMSLMDRSVDLVIFLPCATSFHHRALWTHMTICPHALSCHNLSIKGPVLTATLSL